MAEIRLRARRRVGELLAVLVKRERLVPDAGNQNKAEALAAAGISTSEANRCEQLAKVPAAAFDAYIAGGQLPGVYRPRRDRPVAQIAGIRTGMGEQTGERLSPSDAGIEQPCGLQGIFQSVSHQFVNQMFAQCREPRGTADCQTPAHHRFSDLQWDDEPQEPEPAKAVKTGAGVTVLTT